MFTDWLRRITKGILEPIAAFLARHGIHANTLTVFGCALNILVGIIVGMGYLRWGGVLLIIASAFDALDGTVARRVGRPTKFGAFLDSVLDRVSESAVLLGIAVWAMRVPGLWEELLAYIAIVGSMLVSYTRARGEGLGVSTKVGILTRVERCIVLIVGLVFHTLLLPALWVLAVGTVWTTLHRMYDVYRQVKDQPLTNANST